MRKVFYVMVIGLAGCASAPIGPRVTVMPAPGKPYEVFMGEDMMCRHYAEQAIGAAPNDRATQSFVGSAAVGTAIGAAAGAMSGGHEGSGAAAGLVVGSMAGAGQSAYAVQDAQLRYDMTYQQCMYAKGNQVPGMPMQAAPSQPPQGATPYPPPR